MSDKNERIEADNTPGIYDVLIDAAQRYSNRNAFIYRKDEEDRYITYSTFIVHVAKAEKLFEDNGYSGMNVALIGDNSYEWIVSFFGLICAGAVVVPIGSGVNRSDTKRIIENCNCKAIVCDDNIFSDYCDDGKITGISINSIADLLSKESKAVLNNKSTATAVFSIFDTCINVGKNAGIMMRAKAFYSAFSCFGSYFSADEPVIITLPFEKAVTCAAILYGISIGAQMIILDDLAKTGEYIKEFHAGYGLLEAEDIVYLYDGMIDELERNNKLDEFQQMHAYSRRLLCDNIDKRNEMFKDIRGLIGDKISCITCVGTKLSNAYMASFEDIGITVLGCYGLDQTCGLLTYYSSKTIENTDSIGKMFNDIDAAIEVTHKDEGELLIKTDILMAGYYNDVELNAEVFTSDGYYRTGMIVRTDDEGNIYVADERGNFEMSETKAELMLLKLNENEKSREHKKKKRINKYIKNNGAIRSDIIQNVLITGASGYFGMHVLHELILKNRRENLHLRIYCLEREHGRLTAAFRYYFPNEEISHSVLRIAGNTNKKHFGLNDDSYEGLAYNIDTVFHLEENSEFLSDYEKLKKTNIDTTAEVIDFCKYANAVLYYKSTVNISGFETENALTESVLDIGQTLRYSSYMKQKYIAEEMILLAKKDGLRANIYRTGYISRRSDGMCELGYKKKDLYHIMEAIKKIGGYPTVWNTIPFNFIQVDDCAGAFISLVFTKRIGLIRHLIGKYNTTVDRAGIGISMEDLEFEMLTRQNLGDDDLSIALAYLYIAKKKFNINVNCDETMEELNRIGFNWHTPQYEI